jgi:PAS domain S-box-containing protein
MNPTFTEMNPTFLALKKRVLTTLSLVLVLIMGASSLAFYYYQQGVWEADQRRLNQELQLHFKSQMAHNSTIMETMLDTLEHRQDYLEAFTQQARSQLYSIAQPIYEELRAKHRITHFYFIDPNGVAFLRVHQPDRFGDTIQHQSLRNARESGQDGSGLEIGQLGTYTLRLVRPWRSNGHTGEVIGYLELGMEIEHALSHITKELNTDLMVLLEKRAISRKVWEQGLERLGRSGEWEQFGRQVILYDSNAALSSRLQRVIETGLQQELHYLTRQLGGRTYNLGFVPLYSLKHEEQGLLVTTTDITPLSDALKRQIQTILYICLSISLLYFLFLYLYLDRIERSILLNMRESEDGLMQSEALLKEAQRIGQIGSWFLDLHKKRLSWSDEIYAIYGLPSSIHPSYQQFITLVHPDDRDQVAKIYTEALKQLNTCQTQHRIITPAGKVIWTEDRLEMLYRPGEKKAYMVRGTVQDITRHKEAEAEIERVSRAKDEFLASMSHELRTPLTNIIGNCEFLSEQEQDPEKQKLIHSIEISGRSQLALVNDILDISKIESGKFTIDDAPYSLPALLNDIRHIFSLRIQDAGLSFVVEQRSEFPHQLSGDAQRIGQILINLISNAIKFTDQGTVTLRCWSDSQQLHFSVSENGIGMSPSVQVRLFQPFEQADHSISRRFGGTGLGLYVSHNLAQLMGGSIAVESAEGVGSTFTLQLPFRPTEIPTTDSAERRPGEQALSRPQISGNVLIAEDTPELQLLERRILESMGATVTTAQNGRIAVELASQQQFDLILMDMQMPEMDGIEATRLLRAAGNPVPVIALTANVMQKHRDAFNAAGCDGFLEKPINKQALAQLVQTTLQHRPATDTPFTSVAGVDEELRTLFGQRVTEMRARLSSACDQQQWEAATSAAAALLEVMEIS